MAHTKGEWTLRGPARNDGADDYAIIANGQIIAETFGRTNVDNYEPSLDNARLIVQSPKMHEALIMIDQIACYPADVVPEITPGDINALLDKIHQIAFEAHSKVGGAV